MIEPERWLSLSEAALVREVSVATIRHAAYDGRIRSRRALMPSRRGFYTSHYRIEVWWPDVSACQFYSRGGGGTGVSSGPVTDATWARFCEVFDQFVERMREGDRA